MKSGMQGSGYLCEAVSGWSLATVRLALNNDLIKLISSMVAEL